MSNDARKKYFLLQQLSNENFLTRYDFDSEETTVVIDWNFFSTIG